jgi:hypothetical protein
MPRTNGDAHLYGNNDTHAWFVYDHESPYYIPAYNGPPPPSDTHVQYDSGAYESTPYENGNSHASFGNGRLDERLTYQGPNDDNEGQRHLTQRDDAFVERAAELGLTPRELQELNDDCIREQTEWLAAERS